VTEYSDPSTVDKLKTRIQGLRAKTTDHGCTEAEALLAAAKVAELLDRYDLSLTRRRNPPYSMWAARV